MTDVKPQTGVDERLGPMADRLGLSDDEWNPILDGTMGDPLYSDDAVRWIAEAVEDPEPGYFEKWGVDRGSLLARLSKLDGLSRLALVHRLDRLRA